jgi:membrane protein
VFGFIFRYGRFGWQVCLRFTADNCTFLAAALCYFVFFSIFPLLLVLIAIAGHFLTAEQAMSQVMLLTRPLFPQQQSLVGEILVGVTQHRGEASLFGFIVLLWSAKNIFLSLGQALNVIWGVKTDRGWLIENILAIGLALSVGVMIIVVSVGLGLLTALISFKLPVLGWSPGQIPGLLFLAAKGLPVCLAVFTLTSLYVILPNRSLRWRDVLPGALVAAALWELFRRIFGYYLENVASYDLVYGPLSGIVGFLFWIYISASLFLLGAEVSRVRSDWRDEQAALNKAQLDSH